MAIIPDLPGIEVTICVHDVPIQEYAADDSEEEGAASQHLPRAASTITKYIESVEGQEFSIRYSIERPYKLDRPTLSFKTRIDGVKTHLVVVEDSVYRRTKSFKQTSYGASIGKPGGLKSLRPYKFSKIETCGDDVALARVKEDTKRMLDTGEIVVGLYHGGATVVLPRRVHSGTSPDLGTSAKVHEKALKGQAKYHRASLGEAQRRGISRKTKSVPSYYDKTPVARIIFKYRSKDALKQLLVIPRSPEPETPPWRCNTRSLSVNGLNDSQLSEVQQYVQNLKGRHSDSKLAKIKREREEDGEGSTPRKSLKANGKSVVIDLTDD